MGGEGVVGREVDDCEVENGLAELPAGYDGLFAVVDDLFWHTAEVIEGPDVLPKERRLLLVLREVDVLPAAVVQGEAEGLDGAAAARKRVRRPVALSLLSWLGLDRVVGAADRFRADVAQVLADDGVLALEALGLKLFEDAHRRDVREVLEQCADLSEEGVELRRSRCTRFGQGTRKRIIDPVAPLRVLFEDLADGLRVDALGLRDLSL